MNIADKELTLHHAVYAELEDLEAEVGAQRLAPLRHKLQKAVQHAYNSGMLDILDCRAATDNEIRADLVKKVRLLSNCTLLRDSARLSDDDKQRDALRREDSVPADQ